MNGTPFPPQPRLCYECREEQAALAPRTGPPRPNFAHASAALGATEAAHTAAMSALCAAVKAAAAPAAPASAAATMAAQLHAAVTTQDAYRGALKTLSASRELFGPQTRAGLLELLPPPATASPLETLLTQLADALWRAAGVGGYFAAFHDAVEALDAAAQEQLALADIVATHAALMAAVVDVKRAVQTAAHGALAGPAVPPPSVDPLDCLCYYCMVVMLQDSHCERAGPPPPAFGVACVHLQVPASAFPRAVHLTGMLARLSSYLWDSGDALYVFVEALAGVDADFLAQLRLEEVHERVEAVYALIAEFRDAVNVQLGAIAGPEAVPEDGVGAVPQLDLQTMIAKSPVTSFSVAEWMAAVAQKESEEE